MAIPSDFLGFHHRYVRGRTVGSAHRIPRSALALTTGAVARPRARSKTKRPDNPMSGLAVFRWCERYATALLKRLL